MIRNKLLALSTKLTTEEYAVEFIRKAIIVHGDKHDYSKVVYVNSRTKVIVICKEHGEFLVTPHNHLQGTNCPKCAELTRRQNASKTYREIIDISNKVHNNLYQYKEVDNYDIKITSYEKIEIYCPKCDKWFKQNINSHMQGHGCPHCHNIQNYKYNHIKTYKDVIEHSQKLYNHKYIYNMQGDLNKKVLKSDKISYWCPVCNKVFTQKISNHISGKIYCGCRHKKKVVNLPKEKKSKRGRTYLDIINKVNEIHDNKYTYDNNIQHDAFVKSTDKIRIYCLNCEEWFTQSVNSHLTDENGCPICKSSRGEAKVKRYLKTNNINFIYQKTFPDCKRIRVLKFDFYLSDLNICIEFDGEQHYNVAKFSKNEDRNILNFQLTKIRDDIKNKYCNEKGIKLIRIPYKEIDNIENILSSQLTIGDKPIKIDTMLSM